MRGFHRVTAENGDCNIRAKSCCMHNALRSMIPNRKRVTRTHHHSLHIRLGHQEIASVRVGCGDKKTNALEP
ncbi:MAG: hypothetical protein VXV97_14180, partial [Pseudomonadota bacterium]|nr:hypothetical protein [Pseudomonadota bacterium]